VSVPVTRLARERVSIQLGIDQEGRLLDATLPRARSSTPLPRSHTGAVSRTRTYEEIAQ
jgi:hypothetical protein